MRFLYKIVLGIILFQAFIVLLTPFFAGSYIGDNADNITGDTDYTQYEVNDAGDLLGILWSFGGIWGGVVGSGIAGIALVTALVTKNYILIGVGLFLGFLSGFFVMTTSFLTGLNQSMGNSAEVNTVISIVSICLGLLCLFAVIDMFAPGRAAE